MAGLLIGLFAAACVGIVLWAAERQAREHRIRHDPVMCDLHEIDRVLSGEIPVTAAHFEARGPDGVLTDDSDARRVADLEDRLRAHPPAPHVNYP